MVALNFEATPPAPVDAERFRHLIGHFASGVTVITCAEDGVWHASTASAVSSLSLDPPMLLVCLNRTSRTGQAIDRIGHFALNILGDLQSDLATHFASHVEDKFAGIATTMGSSGDPLLNESLAQLECHVEERAVGGTHSVFLARVDNGTARPGQPLAYFRGRFGSFTDSADHQAYRDLRALVVDHGVDIGSELTTDHVAQLLDVSPSSALYALGRLAQAGLLNRRSPSVYARSTIDARLVAHTFKARHALGVGVLADAEELARAASPVEQAAAHLVEHLTDPSEGPLVHEAFCDIYDAILGLGRNPILLDLNLRFRMPSLLGGRLDAHEAQSLRSSVPAAADALVESLLRAEASAAVASLTVLDDLVRQACLRHLPQGDASDRTTAGRSHLPMASHTGSRQIEQEQS